jgi:hypothetical protein
MAPGASGCRRECQGSSAYLRAEALGVTVARCVVPGRASGDYSGTGRRRRWWRSPDTAEVSPDWSPTESSATSEPCGCDQLGGRASRRAGAVTGLRGGPLIGYERASGRRRKDAAIFVCWPQPRPWSSFSRSEMRIQSRRRRGAKARSIAASRSIAHRFTSGCRESYGQSP